MQSFSIISVSNVKIKDRSNTFLTPKGKKQDTATVRTKTLIPQCEKFCASHLRHTHSPLSHQGPWEWRFSPVHGTHSLSSRLRPAPFQSWCCPWQSPHDIGISKMLASPLWRLHLPQKSCLVSLLGSDQRLSTCTAVEIASSPVGSPGLSRCQAWMLCMTLSKPALPGRLSCLPCSFASTKASLSSSGPQLRVLTLRKHFQRSHLSDAGLS